MSRASAARPAISRATAASDHRLPVRARRGAKRQSAEAAASCAKRKHDQRRHPRVGGGRFRHRRSHFASARDHSLDPRGPLLVVVQLRGSGPAAGDLRDHAFLVDEVDRRERRAPVDQLLDDPSRPAFDGCRSLERLAEEREERAVLGGPLGVRLEPGALERDARLLGDAEEERAPLTGRPVLAPRGGGDRADDLAARVAQRQGDQRLGAEPSPLLRQLGVAGVVLVARADRDERARFHRIRDEPGHVERVDAESMPRLVRHARRRQRLELFAVAQRPCEYDVRADCLDLRDGGRRNLGFGRGRGEPRRVPLEQLGVHARVALPFEERGTLERARQLLRDLREHPSLVRRQRAVVVECDADGPRGPRERHHEHRCDAGQQLLELGRVHLLNAIPPVQLDRPALAHRVRGGRGRRPRHGPPTPLFGGQASRHLQRSHVVRAGHPQRHQAGPERLEEVRDARLGDLGGQCRPREARRESLQDVGATPDLVVERAKAGTLQGDDALLCDTDDDRLHVRNEPVRVRSRDEGADASPLGVEERHGEQRPEPGIVRPARGQAIVAGILALGNLDGHAGHHRLRSGGIRDVEIRRRAVGREPLCRRIAPEVERRQVEARCRELGHCRCRHVVGGLRDREARGDLLEELGPLARRALGVVRADESALGRDPRPGERREHERQHRPTEEDCDRRGARDGLAARGEDEGAATERDRARGAARGRLLRREQLGVAHPDAGAHVGRQPRERVRDHLPAEPRAHERDRGAGLLRGGIDRPEGLEPAPAEHERGVLREDRPPRRPGALERAASHGLARQVEALERRPIAHLRPDGDDRDVRRAPGGVPEDLGSRELGDPRAGLGLEARPAISRDDGRQRQPVGRSDRGDGACIRVEARTVDFTVRVDEPRGGTEARQRPPDAVLQRLAHRLGCPTVVIALTVDGSRPEKPCDDHGGRRDEHDEQPAQDDRRGDASLHPWRDTTPTAAPEIRRSRPAASERPDGAARDRSSGSSTACAHQGRAAAREGSRGARRSSSPRARAAGAHRACRAAARRRRRRRGLRAARPR